MKFPSRSQRGPYRAKEKQNCPWQICTKYGANWQHTTSPRYISGNTITKIGKRPRIELWVSFPGEPGKSMRLQLPLTHYQQRMLHRSILHRLHSSCRSQGCWSCHPRGTHERWQYPPRILKIPGKSCFALCRRLHRSTSLPPPGERSSWRCHCLILEGRAD